VTATLPRQELPELPFVDLSNACEATTPAVKRIHSDTDVAIWKKSSAYQTIVLFLARLCESAVGKETQVGGKIKEVDTGPAGKGAKCLDAVYNLLSVLQGWTAEIEPLKSPQRFGNLAFRLWGERLEESVTALHRQLLPSPLHCYIPELETYLLGGFGSWIRLDYGSGHELSFLAWLCFLARIGAFNADEGSKLEEKTEERLALEIIPKYLQVVWGLQDRYGLEPAGSHGVWGLDDYQFIPYAIGAAQLRNQSSYLPSAISSPSHKPDTPKLPIVELLQFIPGPSTLSSRTNPSTGVPPFANLYTTSIARIHSLKKGPFFEHSPILYDVSLSVPNWGKVYSGMMKMWEAECLSKRPVVQHFPFGTVAFPWEGDLTSVEEEVPANEENYRAAVPMTSAPWITAGAPAPPNGGMPHVRSGMPPPATAVPWKTNSDSTMPMKKGPLPLNAARSVASTGSAAAASSPFGILSKPSIPSRNRKE
jgi:serine/threonine-protein phosphatase 2A activator